MNDFYFEPVGNKNLAKPVFFENLLTPDECDFLVSSFAGGFNFTEETQVSKVHVKEIKLQKNTEWFYDILTERFSEVNSRYFRFNLSDLRTVNLLEYQEGYFMDWHRDLGKKDKNFLTRKITMTVFLTPPSAYEGGGIMFMPPYEGELIQKQGAALFYPSFIFHRIEPVTRGIRRIIIASAHGEHFR